MLVAELTLEKQKVKLKAREIIVDEVEEKNASENSEAYFFWYELRPVFYYRMNYWFGFKSSGAIFTCKILPGCFVPSFAINKSPAELKAIPSGCANSLIFN